MAPVRGRRQGPALTNGQAPGLRDDAARATPFHREVIDGERQPQADDQGTRTAVASAYPGPAASLARRQPPGVDPGVPHPAYQSDAQRLRRVVARVPAD